MEAFGPLTKRGFTSLALVPALVAALHPGEPFALRVVRKRSAAEPAGAQARPPAAAAAYQRLDIEVVPRCWSQGAERRPMGACLVRRTSTHVRATAAQRVTPAIGLWRRVACCKRGRCAASASEHPGAAPRPTVGRVSTLSM